MGAISFYHVGPRNQTQIMRLEGEYYHSDAPPKQVKFSFLTT